MSSSRLIWIRTSIWLAFLAISAVALALLPVYGFSLAFWFYLLLWITLASGLNVMAGFTGYLPFGYVAFYGVGAYATAVAVKMHGLPIWGGFIVAALAGALLSLLFARTLVLRGIYFSIVSLALAVICRLLIAAMPEDVAGGSYGISLGFSDPVGAYYAILALLLATLLTVTWLAQSRLGMALRAIRDDPDTAETIGINIGNARLKAWVLSAVIASLTGGIEAWYTSIVDTETAFNLLVSTKAIIFAVAGGLGTVIGPVIGTLVMLVVDDLIWQNFPILNVFLLGMVIVLLMMFLPSGIVGSLVRYKRSLRRFLF
ncbi:branched-chain amino acid ABC transporter permease [Hoeflea sp. Naph1]|uniref:branched-chain amino acid ABC transporter permease n=1 Tax=Hoeflea sp. Naph1 TaxID=3388653 RepID=UPI0039901C17